MSKKKFYKFGLLLVATTIGLGLAFFDRYQTTKMESGLNDTLSLKEVRETFKCDRLTADVLETDIFCSNEKFYNDPDSVSIEDYFSYYGCTERLKKDMPSDSSLQKYYLDCKDKSLLDTKRIEFISQLKRVKDSVVR